MGYVIKGAKGKIKARGYTARVMAVTKDGEIVDDWSEQVPFKFVDSSPHIKVYEPKVFMTLTATGIKVLTYVMCHMRYGNKFTFDIDKAMEFCHLGRSSVFAGMRELLDMDYIQKVRMFEYEVNPNILFKGNRTAVIRKQQQSQ